MSGYRGMDVAALARAQSDSADTALKEQAGFLEWRPAAPAPAPAPLSLVDETDNAAWFHHVNEIRAEVPALGCYQLFDVRLQRHGILFHGDQHVSDGSHLGQVGVEETRQPGGWLDDTEVIVSDRPGILAAAPGVRVYGHWLVDFVPRLRIAQHTLGADFEDFVLPIPIGTPPWALNMMRVLCGLSERNVIWFDPNTQSVEFREMIWPTYGHASYHLHPATSDFWPNAAPAQTGRRLCISRLNYETRTDGVLKSFSNRALFEELAVARGYSIVYPEKLSLSDQMALFAQASHIVGEYGSALHNALFSPPGTVVGAIRCPNDVQLRISALRAQPSVLLLPGREWIDERGGQAYEVRAESLVAFMDAMHA